MWEHAAPIIGIPGAIKALIDLFGRFKDRKATAPEEAQAAAQLRLIEDAMRAFAVDALELKAYKALHSTTNQFMIDLRETFTLTVPDSDAARRHHSSALHEIKKELEGMQGGQRAASQLAALRDDPLLMRYLAVMPEDVTDYVTGANWDVCLWQLLHRARVEVENFKNFQICVEDIRHLNMALNAYADRKIKAGIDDFDKIMDRLRQSLPAA